VNCPTALEAIATYPRGDEMGLLLNILGELAVVVLTFVAGQASVLLNRRRKLGYLRDWIGKSDGVYIVLSNFLPYVEENEFFRLMPKNVVFMPASEGAAVARLVIALRTVSRKVDIHFVSKEYPINPHHLPVICIGGPSVNAVSKEILEKNHAEFRIKYPQHDAYVRNKLFKPATENDEIIEDYGFLASGEFHGAPYVVLCGVYSAGTWAAAQVFINLKERTYRKRLVSRENLFLVSHADVDGFELDPDKVELIVPQPIRLDR